MTNRYYIRCIDQGEVISPLLIDTTIVQRLDAGWRILDHMYDRRLRSNFGTVRITTGVQPAPNQDANIVQ